MVRFQIRRFLQNPLLKQMRLHEKYSAVRELVALYFQMVRDRISESVPKAINYCMVKGIEEYIVEELRASFAEKSDQEIGELLLESEHVTNERARLHWQLEECNKTLEDMETIEVEMKLEKTRVPH